jgi:drug/metabolite transporter (DMT)-like permease
MSFKYTQKKGMLPLSFVLIAAELVSASVAVLLAFLSLFCRKVLRDRGIHRSFWTPVFVSSYLFLVGSLLALLYTFSVDLMSEMKTLEIMYHVSWLAGLGILAYGVYAYLRMIEKS